MARLIEGDTLAILTIAQEAFLEPYAGKLAVAEVIRNRTRQHYMSDGTVEGTVLRAYQFSGWNNGDPVRIKAMRYDDSDSRIQDCIKAWKEAKAGSQTVGQAVLYYNPTYRMPDGSTIKTPKWALPGYGKEVARAGAHVFFVESKEV